MGNKAYVWSKDLSWDFSNLAVLMLNTQYANFSAPRYNVHSFVDFCYFYNKILPSRNKQRLSRIRVLGRPRYQEENRQMATGLLP